VRSIAIQQKQTIIYPQMPLAIYRELASHLHGNSRLLCPTSRLLSAFLSFLSSPFLRLPTFFLKTKGIL